MTAIQPNPSSSDKQPPATESKAPNEATQRRSFASRVMSSDPWTAITNALTRIQRQRRMGK